MPTGAACVLQAMKVAVAEAGAVVRPPAAPELKLSYQPRAPSIQH